MKIRPILYILLVIFLSGCQSKVKTLSKETYTDIILDLQVGETIILNSKVDNKGSLRKAIHQKICEIYGFSDVDHLKESLKPLESDPQLMLDITKIMSVKLDALADSAIAYPQ